MSTPEIITFLPNPVPGNEKLQCLSNPIPYLEYPYLSMSAFLVRLTTTSLSLLKPTGTGANFSIYQLQFLD